MPTPVAHSLAGAAIALVATRRRPLDRNLLGASVVAACLADLDFGIGFLLGKNVHHHFTHSFGFAVLCAGAAYFLARDHPQFHAKVLGASYLSHVLLDLLSKDTAPPFGLQILWPLSEEFHISPILVFDDIWRGSLAKLFGLHNWLAVAREVLIVGPAAVIALWSWKRGQRYSKNPLPVFRPR
jgi:membrane-bound metal-dependent hydrolase YbcI (DUF457 family)